MEQGADVILPVAGDWVGSRVLKADRESRGVYAIGADTDWALTYHEFADVVLTSIEKRMDVSVIRTVRSIVHRSFTGGAHTGTLQTGEVNLAPFHKTNFLVFTRVIGELKESM